jgi:hypothetical protein
MVRLTSVRLAIRYARCWHTSSYLEKHRLCRRIRNDSLCAPLEADGLAIVSQLRSYFVDPANGLQTPVGVFALRPDGFELPYSLGPVSFPKDGTRARRIVIVDFWGSVNGTESVSRASDLEALAPLRRRSASASSLFDRTLSHHRSEHVATLIAYPTTVDNALVVDDRFEGLANERRFDRVHLSPLSVDLSAFTFHGQEEMVAHWQSCASCHPDQFNAWKASRHSRAFLRLVTAGQSGDARCTPCHTDAASSAPVSLAVTCQSCHDGSGHGASQAVETCTRCHTDVTDPLSHYRTGLKTICSSKVHRGSDVQHCPR